MYRLLTRAEVLALLAPYGGRYAGDYHPGAERWLTAWDFEFALTPEDGQMYHEFMVLEAIRLSIEPSRPAATS